MKNRWQDELRRELKPVRVDDSLKMRILAEAERARFRRRRQRMAMAAVAVCVLVCAIVIFVQTYRSALLRNAETTSRQAIAQVSSTLEEYLEENPDERIYLKK